MASQSSSASLNGHNGQSNGSSRDTNLMSETEVIVNDFLVSQLSLKGYQWSPNDINYNGIEPSKRTKIGESLRLLGEAYDERYDSEFASMCERIEVTPSIAYAAFLSISDELFCEGIKWSHIVTYLVFGAEFALYSASKGFPHLIHEISHWMVNYVTGHLIHWINDHGGWDGVIQFAQETIGQPQENGHRQFGFKNFIYGAAGALGMLTLGLFLTTKT